MSKNVQILILIGAPGSGKTTFARYFVRTEENWIRLCRDDFRSMQFTTGNMSNYEESLIADMIDASVETLLLNQSNILLDAPHCRREYIEHYIERFNRQADISFKLFDADIATLIERCEKRFQNTGKFVSEAAIKRYIEDLEELKKEFDFSFRPKINDPNCDATQDAGLPKAGFCD